MATLTSILKSLNLFLIAARSRLPDIDVNSAGTPAITTGPILRSWVGRMLGCQAYGKDISPVAINIGFGYWQSIKS